MTPAIHALDEANIQYQLLEYSHERSNDGFGNEAVEKLGLSDDVVFKTLLVQLSSQEIIVCLVPVGLSLNLKAVARAAGVKKAALAPIRTAEKRTGYVTGGISPFGQLREHRTFIDKSAFPLNLIYVSAGRRGLEVCVPPEAFSVLLGATFVTLTDYE